MLCKSETYFYSLAALATLLLWGISILNGTVKALLLAAWTGKLTNSLPLKTDYTGIPLLDYPIAILVAFFFYGTNGEDEGFQLFLLDAYSALQPAFIWLYVEMNRPGHKPTWVDRPVVFGILWQCFGAAISLPLYYGVYLQWSRNGHVCRSSCVYGSVAVVFSFLFGAILPAVIGMAPTWLGSDCRSALSHQWILAIWQPDPLWVHSIWTASKNTTRFCWPISTTSSKNFALRWTLASYLLAGACSATGHLYVVARILLSAEEGTNIRRMYLPYPLLYPPAAENILKDGPWLFLKYDFIIISLCSLSWVYLLLASAPNRRGISKTSLAVGLICGGIVLGPGAAVSLALYARERMLPEHSTRLKEL